MAVSILLLHCMTFTHPPVCLTAAWVVQALSRAPSKYCCGVVAIVNVLGSRTLVQLVLSHKQQGAMS